MQHELTAELSLNIACQYSDHRHRAGRNPRDRDTPRYKVVPTPYAAKTESSATLVTGKPRVTKLSDISVLIFAGRTVLHKAVPWLLRHDRVHPWEGLVAL